ncbi:expressed unknown protein [Seminavis robusta]|uniref:Uncharacterized protein n=1 Tax=Seminavis robusta TaxID=568900 RepID=A0A9N8EBX1_9STRA|nr:expressed unknown protein [Seminavis robusta]|eukprot:Sro866_g212980.1 n/a (429) ;mRNA; f:13464-14750
MNLPEIIMERVKVGLELKNIVKHDLPLDTWWEPANEENPRLAYERFLDTTRLAVELAYTTEGDAIGLYAAKANDDSRLAFKFLVDFLQQAKRQRRMPRWWTPQHDVCLFRLAFDEKGDFYLYHAVEVSDVRKTWGYRTTKLLLALATTIDGEDGVPEGRFDDMLRIACDLYLDETPQREKGYENGEGIPCRWGVKCKRPDCWFQHPKLVLGEETKRSDQPQYSTTNMKDHMLELVGDELELETLYLLYHQSLGIGESIFYHVSPAEQAETQRKLKESASKGDSFAMYLLGKIWKELKVPMFGKQKSAKSRHSEACKLWTASALAGNAYAMTGLALLHRDAGHMPTAVHWWQRALEHAEFPEAAYDLGVAYGLNETVGADAVPNKQPCSTPLSRIWSYRTWKLTCRVQMTSMSVLGSRFYMKVHPTMNN